VNATELLTLAQGPTLIPKAQGMDAEPWQREFLFRQDGHLLLNCCRGAGKSRVTSALALHTALFQPGSLTLLISRPKPHRHARPQLRVAARGPFRLAEGGELKHPKPTQPATSPGPPPEVKFTALEEIEHALTARVESLPLDQRVQDYFDRRRGRVLQNRQRTKQGGGFSAPAVLH
jgi:hypothetical protein